MKRIDVNVREDQYESLRKKVSETFKTMSHFVREALDKYFGNGETHYSEHDYPVWLHDILIMLNLIEENVKEGEDSVELYWDILLLPIYGQWNKCRKNALSLCYYLKQVGCECYEEDDIGDRGKRDFIGIKFNFPDSITKERLMEARTMIIKNVMEKRA